ncbi:hypothetical protein VD0002_g9086 [Verticillium dahliae]|uniref:lytic cellulose monooxygenase (C4-dehydrogenating) n=1 Tax=Verticillium dahliae TaxID=27337 RepID=A0A444RZG0_VERDA|nr:hypothetical protein BJF96_g769 [Verticillium dahliae]PNH37354.1 hypothetical protein VD0004_g9433 [Verticillium dahliae]PNH58443.1 hypothetical protein VD0002_g9086 [Verticillium dahliae]PNH62398.1 hypothetical protein VD0001_g9454 [Verticillium dahliae]RXG46561.1 hypothetical protein VDGE_05987 [Verticillium dahliae]
MVSKLSALLAIAATVPTAFAHYNFESLIVNGAPSEAYEFVRRTTNSNSPIEDVTSPNMICNQGGIDAAIMAATNTKTVQAGDQLGFKVNSELGHPGPQAVYLSKAPGAAQDYKGDGDWFKIYELTYSEINEQGIQWATFVNNQGVHNFTFTLPKELPDGEYLVRAEHTALHAAGAIGGAQFYMGCAQIKVEGGGNGTPSPTVKFPGAYDGTEPGIHIGIYYPAPTEYKMFGPVTWPNACSDHTANLDGQESDGDCTGDDGAAAPAPAPVPVPSPAPAPAPPAGGNATVPVPPPAAGGDDEPTAPEETVLPAPVETEYPSEPEYPVPAPTEPVSPPSATEPVTAPPADGEEDTGCPATRRRRALRKARKARLARRQARFAYTV